MAQLRAQTAERKADTALSSTRGIVDQTIRAQSTADDAIAEARVVREEVESRISELLRRAEINTSSVLGEFTGQVRQVIEQSEAQTSRTVGSAVKQLEKEIEVAASKRDCDVGTRDPGGSSGCASRFSGTTRTDTCGITAQRRGRKEADG